MRADLSNFTASSNSSESLIAPVGHTSSHLPQKIQRPQSNSQISLFCSAFNCTVIALEGHAIPHAAHPIHRSKI